jgi:serine protease Do
MLTAAIMLTFLIAGCGGAGGGAAGSLEDVKPATVQVVAKGTFRDPQEGMVTNVAGAGTGFIIDPSGLVVTNNHVVTGAALLEVYIGGDTEPHNAKVLGVSECSDLAVIDIEGEGYPYLEWYQGDITVGMDVYAAGYPLGNPEYTLTKGIVAKEKAAGDTPWSSVERVIEHDATINPGNSGGPLVTPDGKVVGVNYAKSAASQFVAAQYFAINREAAMPVIEKLKAGEDVNSIGINGQAVNIGEGYFGIWVASVKSGSPADVAGIKPGDILVALEDLFLAEDLTLRSYCDVLKTHNSGDVMNIRVLRYDTMEILQGQLNGRPLEVSTSFGQEPAVQEQVSQETAGGYSGYSEVMDDSGALVVEIPLEWQDIDGSIWLDSEGKPYGAMLVASTDLHKYGSGWSTPGMRLQAARGTADYTVDELLDLDQWYYVEIQNCEPGDRYDFETPDFRGKYDLYANCGGQQVALVVLYVFPKSNPQAYGASISAHLITEADLEALDRIMSTFNVVGSLP